MTGVKVGTTVRVADGKGIGAPVSKIVCSVTVEAARLQTFPDQYQFIGNYDQVSVQIGNAVPVVLAEAFAKHFVKIEQLSLQQNQ